MIPRGNWVTAAAKESVQMKKYNKQNSLKIRDAAF